MICFLAAESGAEKSNYFSEASKKSGIERSKMNCNENIGKKRNLSFSF